MVRWTAESFDPFCTWCLFSVHSFPVSILKYLFGHYLSMMKTTYFSRGQHTLSCSLWKRNSETWGTWFQCSELGSWIRRLLSLSLEWTKRWNWPLMSRTTCRNCQFVSTQVKLLNHGSAWVKCLKCLCRGPTFQSELYNCKAHLSSRNIGKCQLT